VGHVRKKEMKEEGIQSKTELGFYNIFLEQSVIFH